VSINDVDRVALREDTRRAIENLELWLRRWIDAKMRSTFGNAYLDHEVSGNRVVKKKIVDSLRQRVAAEPARYPRDIDAIHLDDAIAITCHPQCFSLFSAGYTDLFPQASVSTIKALMERIVSARHRVSHANEIALQDALRVISMSFDVVEAIKKQFEMQNRGREFNVPTLVKISDSFGGVWHQGQQKPPSHTVYPGDSVTVYAEVDPTFDAASYQIRWQAGSSSHIGHQFTYTFTVADVGELFVLWCRVVQSKPWHRRNGYDDQYKIPFQVLPLPS
jgi:hypothetical protein